MPPSRKAPAKKSTKAATASSIKKPPKTNAAPARDVFTLVSQLNADSDFGAEDKTVIGVFSDWTALVKKAQAIMKKQGFTLRCVKLDTGRLGTIPQQPPPAHLTHMMCLACTDEGFSIHVQRTLFVVG